MADLELNPAAWMLPFNSDGLSAQLSQDFATLANNTKDAADIAGVVAMLSQETSGIIQRLVAQWSAQNTVLRRLPDELMALCFTFLPFRSRIAASHVSRSWRTISLANPAIWAHVDISDLFRKRHKLLRMALARTGNVPVDLHGPFRSEYDTDGIVGPCLLEHIHHIRLIRWSSPVGSLPLTTVAPMLETLFGIDYHINIPANFLGGAAQRLRTLHLSSVSFPASCPALSTVTKLSIDGPATIGQATTFIRFFDLFPALQILCLSQLSVAFKDLLPPGPAPSSLRELQLFTPSSGYDLMRHYVDWSTDNLRDVLLDQSTSILPHLRQFVGAPTELEVLIEYNLSRTCIRVRGPGAGQVRSVTFMDEEENAHCVARMLLDAQADLRGLQSVTLPIRTLASFMPVLAVLPALRRLCVFVKASSDFSSYPASHRLPWRSLPTLLPAQKLCPVLEEVELEFVCWNEDCPLNVDDARELIALLAPLGEQGLCNVCITGFSEAIVRDVDVGPVDAYGMYFNSS